MTKPKGLVPMEVLAELLARAKRLAEKMARVLNDVARSRYRLRDRQTACMAVGQKHHASYSRVGKISIV
jgi:hypothetical protein